MIMVAAISAFRCDPCETTSMLQDKDYKNWAAAGTPGTLVGSTSVANKNTSLT